MGCIFVGRSLNELSFFFPTKVSAAEISQIQQEWDAAFLALYTQLIHGHCPLFYLMSDILNVLFWWDMGGINLDTNRLFSHQARLVWAAVQSLQPTLPGQLVVCGSC